jgi:transposase-like protein
MGILERSPKKGGSRVKLQMVQTTKRRELMPMVEKHVMAGSRVYTDAHMSYFGLAQDYFHSTVDHAKEYVRGMSHTNGMENFWSLLKRTIRGTYVSVEPFHLPGYLCEQAFRFNTRDGGNAARFVMALGSIVGRRLTYRGLIGAQGPQTA